MAMAPTPSPADVLLLRTETPGEEDGSMAYQEVRSPGGHPTTYKSM